MIFSLGCSLGLLIMSVFGTSPQEAQQLREPPNLTPPTAKVERQIVSNELRAGCEAAAKTHEITASRTGNEDLLVITKLDLKIGEPITTGDLLFELSGQPVVAVETEIPFYRDLSVGVSGDDVELLEQNLVAVGLLEKANSDFDDDTSTAVRSLFERYGLSTDSFRLRNIRSIPPNVQVTGITRGLGEVVEPDSPILTVTSSDLAISCVVPPSVPVKEGEPALLQLGTADVEGTLSQIQEPDPSGFIPVTFTPLDTLSAVDTSGQLELVIEVESSGEEVLSVPVGALFENPSGGFEVRRVTDERVEPVPIKIGTVASGFVEVLTESLEEGDEVQLHNNPVSAPGD